jgi:hypothetical protein
MHEARRLTGALDSSSMPTEKNGFSVIDVKPTKMTFRLFLWRPPEPLSVIDNLQPLIIYEVARSV